MTLRADEYTIDGDKITIPKKVLEELEVHYYELWYNEGDNECYYLGKRDVFTDLLKLFDKLEG